MAKIFISYRRDDSQWPADRLYEAIQAYVEDPENDIFIDVDNIPLGVNFKAYLDARVGQCEILLALIGPNWLNARDPASGKRRLEDPNDFVRIEIASALKRGIRVVPVLLDGTPMPTGEGLPEDLHELLIRNGLEVRRLSFDADTERLARGLGLSVPRKQRSTVKRRRPSASSPVLPSLGKSERVDMQPSKRPAAVDPAPLATARSPGDPTSRAYPLHDERDEKRSATEETQPTLAANAKPAISASSSPDIAKSYSVVGACVVAVVLVAVTAAGFQLGWWGTAVAPSSPERQQYVLGPTTAPPDALGMRAAPQGSVPAHEQEVFRPDPRKPLTLTDLTLNDVWLTSSLYGSTDVTAALKRVKIEKADVAYAAWVENQFGFSCVLEANAEGNPARLSNCESKSEPDWGAKEQIIPLRCSNMGKEQICSGEYTLISGSSRFSEEIKIVRRVE